MSFVLNYIYNYYLLLSSRKLYFYKLEFDFIYKDNNIKLN